MSKIKELNNILFDQLNRLNDKDLNSDELKNEAIRAKAIADVSSKVLETAHITIEATKIINEFGVGKTTKSLVNLTEE
ncbi:MAG: hypothetical protein ACK5LJ_17650 [Paracoccus sp. (in: a-proteobacteria)]